MNASGFIIRTPRGETIRFHFYLSDAPDTCRAFSSLLPFSRDFVHARVSGQEIWTGNAPVLDIPQENASVFALDGEVVFGPLLPIRVKTAGCLGIYYGEGKGLDAANIFARVFDEDLPLLKSLGERIWLNGTQALLFEKLIT